MNTKIQCEICGRSFRQIHHRHVKQHGLTIEEYKRKFPNAPINSEASSEARSKSLTGREITWKDKISQSNIESWQKNPNQGRTGIPLSEESRHAISQKLMGHSVSDETRIKIGLSGLGRIPWNKNLTKDDDPRLVSVSDKVREWNRTYMTPDIRKKIGQTLKQRYADGMPIPQSKAHWRSDLNMYFRSTWEANYARILNHIGQAWTYEKQRFPLMDGDEIVCVYTPDFFTNKLIEIKGHARAADDWECNCKRCERDRFRVMLFLDQFPENELEIIGKKEYRDLSSQYASIIPHWEKSCYDKQE